MTEQPKPATDKRVNTLRGTAGCGRGTLASLIARIDAEVAARKAAEEMFGLSPERVQQAEGDIDADRVIRQEDLAAEFSEKDAQRIAELEAERDSWRSKHDAKLEALRRRSQEKASLEDVVQTMRERIDELEAEANRRHHNEIEKSRRIAELEEHVADAGPRIFELNSECTALRGRIADLEAKLKAAEERAGGFKRSLDAHHKVTDLPGALGCPICCRLMNENAELRKAKGGGE